MLVHYKIANIILGWCIMDIRQIENQTWYDSVTAWNAN